MAKCCPGCSEIKDLCAFSKDRAQRDGYDSRCKECRRQWREENKELKREIDRSWYVANKSKSNASSRAWKRKNPHRVAMHDWKRRERERLAPGGPFNPARPDYQQKLRYYSGMCAYCMAKKAETFDHGIPLSKGGGNWAANIWPACFSCNTRKGTKKLYSEWHPSRTSSPLPLP